MTWQIIDTAPKDGSEILLWGKIDGGSPYFRQHIGHFFQSSNRENGGWWVVSSMPATATYWQPLPPPPGGP